MTEDAPRIYFLGSGIFAVPVLERLAGSDKIDLVGAGTQPDKAAGRKRILTPTQLGQWADANSVPCERIPSVNTEEFLGHIKNLALDMIVVVSFGQILKEALLNATPFGCLNVHGSLLPKYRGASPVKSAILNGEHFTGVSFMRMEKGLDTGPVFQSFSIETPSGICVADLEKRLAYLAAERIENCILKIIAGKLEAEPQNHAQSTMSRKIHKCDGSVNWHEDALIIERKVRAYHVWPNVSFCFNFKNRIVTAKITAASYTSWEAEDSVPGEVIAHTNNKLMVRCGRGALIIERIQPEGKKDMPVEDFQNGHHIAVGEIFINGPGATTDNS